MTLQQERVLRTARRYAEHGMDVRTGRSLRLETMRECIDAGWMREADELGVASDGDGYALQPERWVRVYELTDAGREALRALDAREAA